MLEKIELILIVNDEKEKQLAFVMSLEDIANIVSDGRSVKDELTFGFGGLLKVAESKGRFNV